MAKNADDGGDAIFQNQMQLALDAKEKGKFDQTSYDKSTGNYNQFWMAGRTGNLVPRSLSIRRTANSHR